MLLLKPLWVLVLLMVVVVLLLRLLLLWVWSHHTWGPTGAWFVVVIWHAITRVHTLVLEVYGVVFGWVRWIIC